MTIMLLQQINGNIVELQKLIAMGLGKEVVEVDTTKAKAKGAK